MINVEVGLCTKDMAKENPVKDLEILIEEHKDKWSKQMYDYFKECLNEIKKKVKAFDTLSKDYEKVMKELSKEIEKNRAFEIIKEHILYCENVDCFVFVNITKEVNELLKEILL